MSGSTEDGGAVPAAPPLRNRNVSFWATGRQAAAATAMAEDSVAGIVRRTSTGGFYEDPSEVVRLTAEIERLKRKALSRGVNLTSKDEQVPAEDVAMLKQIFGLADSTGDGFIDEEELIAMHQVLGEPMTPSEATSAFKAMDMNESGNISFDDFLSWYTLAHSRSGMLSKKGRRRAPLQPPPPPPPPPPLPPPAHSSTIPSLQAYTARFKKIMNKIEGSFDLKHLTTTTTGKPKSLDYRVQFHYNVKGQLKQISPWHDIPLYSPEGHCHLIVEIPKFSRAKFEIATGEEYNPIKQDVKNGKLRNYNYGDMLFNYGAFPQTWEDPAHVTPDTGHGGDNDPIDAVEIGTKMYRTGSVVKVKVLGCLAMIDDGETDWKCVVIAADDVLAPMLNDIDDVERVLPGTIDVMREWLRLYKTVDGKPENKFGMEERAMGREYTMAVVQETHEFWRKLTSSGQKTV